jgi:hypothetical protein
MTASTAVVRHSMARARTGRCLGVLPWLSTSWAKMMSVAGTGQFCIWHDIPYNWPPVRTKLRPTRCIYLLCS